VRQIRCGESVEQLVVPGQGEKQKRWVFRIKSLAFRLIASQPKENLRRDNSKTFGHPLQLAPELAGVLLQSFVHLHHLHERTAARCPPALTLERYFIEAQACDCLDQAGAQDALQIGFLSRRR
jgi:hypothetical protein